MGLLCQAIFQDNQAFCDKRAFFVMPSKPFLLYDNRSFLLQAGLFITSARCITITPSTIPSESFLSQATFYDKRAFYAERSLSGSPTIDYDSIRAEAAGLFADKVKDVRAYVTRLQKAQRAAEQELDRCHASRVLILLDRLCW